MSRLTKRNADGTAWYNRTAEREVKNGDILEKLAHYEDLEEAGRLIELPCKVGDMAYYIDKENKIKYGVVHEITIGQRFCWFTLRREAIVFKDKKGGRTSEFFLTKAEAEAKLEELKGGEKALKGGGSDG